MPSAGLPRKLEGLSSNLPGPLYDSFGPFGREIPEKSEGSQGLSAPGSKKVETSQTKVENVEDRLFLTRF